MKSWFLVLGFPVTALGQQILHYSETSGFDHGTRAVSLSMFQTLGTLDGFTVVDDQDGSEFNTSVNLLQYDAIVFSNTSGDAILDSAQRAHFESYITAGGDVMGIHAASDTYRHSSANGGNTGTWDFYAETIGASVQQSPNHVSGTPSYMMSHVGVHQSTSNLPDPWTKNEEYYYWLNGYYNNSNVRVLEVEQTTGPNGMVNAYDSTRAMSWYRELASGSRVFYTALGHAQSNFTSDTLFRQHIRGALMWLFNGTTSTHDRFQGNPKLHVHISDGILYANWGDDRKALTHLTLWSMSGPIRTWSVQGNRFSKSMEIPSAIYVLTAEWEGRSAAVRFLWPE